MGTGRNLAVATGGLGTDQGAGGDSAKGGGDLRQGAALPYLLWTALQPEGGGREPSALGVGGHPAQLFNEAKSLTLQGGHLLANVREHYGQFEDTRLARC